MLLASGDPTTALPLCQTVAAASAGLPDRITQLGQATRLLCLCAQNLGDPTLAQDSAVRALADIERYGDDRDFAVFLDTMSMWFGLSGFRRLATLVRRAATGSYDTLDASGIPPLVNLAAVVAHDNPLEAMQLAQEAITRGERLGVAQTAASGHFVTAAVSLGKWAEAGEQMRQQRAEGMTALRDWETYLAAGSAYLAWGMEEPSLLVALPEGEMSPTDGVVAGWWLMHAAVTAALSGDMSAGAMTIVRAIERMGETGWANEDLPMAYALAVDLLVPAGNLDQLEAITTKIEEVPRGQRFRLLHGMLLRARALLDGGSVTGLRASLAVFDAMGARYWAARVRVELARALLDAHEDGAVDLLDAAEPTLRSAGAVRALREIEEIRASLVPAAAT
jgi:hypothetical protein